MTSDQDAADARFLRVLLFIGIGLAVVVALVLGVTYYQDQARQDCAVDRMFADMTGSGAPDC